MGFWSRSAMNSTGSGSSSSSSSASSSCGLRTPEWGAQPDVRIQGDGYSRHSNQQEIDESWQSEDMDALQSHKDDPPQIPSRQFLELPAPPPLLLPSALLDHEESVSAARSTRKASPRRNSVDTILASDSNSSSREHTPTSTLSDVSPIAPEDKVAQSTTPTPASALPQPTPSKRKKRGRSRSIHLLWRSEVEASAWYALQEYYQWSTGESWPQFRQGGLEFWSYKMNMAGL